MDAKTDKIIMAEAGILPGWPSERMLRWPKQFSNTAALLAVATTTMKSRVLTAKLRFLHRVINSDCQSLSGLFSHSLRMWIP